MSEVQHTGTHIVQDCGKQGDQREAVLQPYQKISRIKMTSSR